MHKTCGSSAENVLLQRDAVKDQAHQLEEIINERNGRFLPQSASVLIRNAEGQVLGAAGASGGSGDEDESICVAGIEAAGLRHA
jgi:uncharacterized protein GlcG (DUF336 family)